MPGHSPHYKIIQVTEASEELYQACQRLIPQLTRNNPAPTRQELARLLSEASSILFVAQDQDCNQEIIGLATLALYRVPTGMRAIIEDVVVNDKARGKGIGEALLHACLAHAQQAGCRQVMLTSNPGRTAANSLYQRMGFELRKTNVYRYSFKG